MTQSAAPEVDDFPQLAAARQLWEARRLDDALAQFAVAVDTRPRNVKALLEGARAFGQRHEIARAEEWLDRVGQLAGDDPRVAPVVAQTYRHIYRPHRAMEIFQRLHRAGGLAPNMLGELALLYEQTNQIAQAEDLMREVVAAAPQAPEPRLVLARILRRAGKTEEALTLLNDLTSSSGAHPLLLAQAWGELCQLLDQQQDYDGAVAAIEKSKGILRALPESQRLARQALANNDVLGQLYADFTAERLAEWSAEAFPPDPRIGGVAHLIGFPRSGTTLLEQVLDAHPGLADSPERVIFSRDVFRSMYTAFRPDGAPTLATLSALPREYLCRQRTRYFDYMEAALGEPIGGRVHLDKNPSHTSLLAGLYRLLPESRFLVALRDPRDVLVSVYLRNFSLSEFSACFLTWGGCCLMYAFEMSVWLRMRELLPRQSWEEIRYEDVVNDLEGQARRALSLLGLPWDDAVLAYRERSWRKVVNSPSHDTVRQPVYRKAVERWRHYEKQIAPYVERLRPFIHAFGYT
jgi:tetratricopeptide (TPR) repeat protein